MPSALPASVRQTITAWNDKPRLHGGIPVHPETDVAAVLARVMAEPVPDIPDREANAEFCAALAQAGIGTSRLAKLLRCSSRAVRHWRLDREPPRAVAILVLLIAAGKVSVRAVEKLTRDHTY